MYKTTAIFYYVENKHIYTDKAKIYNIVFLIYDECRNMISFSN